MNNEIHFYSVNGEYGFMSNFAQYPIRVRGKTWPTSLIEHTARDSYWGDGGDGSGKNMLGRILMEVRQELGKDNENTRRAAIRRENSR